MAYRISVNQISKTIKNADKNYVNIVNTSDIFIISRFVQKPSI